jgi:Pyruvate:ferredoxin oxidoreductase and related 2-oxoacid:ferredoxin oxidoreductases, alpha subunit
VIVVMGSAAETIGETVAYLCGQGERVGMLQVRLYRPFPARALLDALPASASRIAVLDRTKEPGSNGEPLFLDVVATLAEAHTGGERAVLPLVTGGRYGLSSKELTPGMVAGVFAELARERPRPRFTIGIHDDVSGLSLPMTRRWTSNRPARSARSSSASARTARSARTRTRSRSSAPRRT